MIEMPLTLYGIKPNVFRCLFKIFAEFAGNEYIRRSLKYPDMDVDAWKIETPFLIDRLASYAGPIDWYP